MSVLPHIPDSLPLAEEDEAFRTSFRSWLEGAAPRGPEPSDRVDRYHARQAWQRLLAEHGWAGVTWPRAFGGMEASPLQQFLYYEELGRVRAPEFPNRPGLILIAPTLMKHGSGELQDRYLPGMLTADEIWAQGFSEPGAGSDLAGLRTMGSIDGDRVRITGQKTWVTAGDVATHAAVLCRTGDPQGRHRTLSLVLVDLDQSGVEVRPIRASDGEIPFCEIYFDGATAPLDHAIGGLNKGWAAAMTMLEFERGDLTFTDHRPILAKLDDLAVHLAKARQSQPESERLAGLDSELVDLWLQAHHLRELNIQMMYRRAGGGSVGFWGSPVKLVWAQLFQRVQSLALESADLTLGLESPAFRDYLYSRMSTVYSGAIDIQRTVIAERLLGLPRATGDRPAAAAKGKE